MRNRHTDNTTHKLCPYNRKHSTAILLRLSCPIFPVPSSSIPPPSSTYCILVHHVHNHHRRTIIHLSLSLYRPLYIQPFVYVIHLCYPLFGVCVYILHCAYVLQCCRSCMYMACAVLAVCVCLCTVCILPSCLVSSSMRDILPVLLSIFISTCVMSYILCLLLSYHLYQCIETYEEDITHNRTERSYCIPQQELQLFWKGTES